MKKLLLLSLTVLLFSCGDNDDSNSDSTQNFLEKYNGDIWKKDDGLDSNGNCLDCYYRFTPNSITTARISGSTCEPISTNWDVEDSEGLYYSVKENLAEKLVFEFLQFGDLVTYTITTINDGNGIEIDFDGNDIWPYTRVSDFCE